ncbi:carboxypeptidase-like regulatory domain-containing protein [Nanoarchaeota archaeon]
MKKGIGLILVGVLFLLVPIVVGQTHGCNACGVVDYACDRSSPGGDGVCMIDACGANCYDDADGNNCDPDCTYAAEADCTNNYDDDCDGLRDCADVLDCGAEPTCNREDQCGSGQATCCSDTINNDFPADGDTDCADSDCASVVVGVDTCCQDNTDCSGGEVCDSGANICVECLIDNDCLPDNACQDYYCSGTNVCEWNALAGNCGTTDCDFMDSCVGVQDYLDYDDCTRTCAAGSCGVCGCAVSGTDACDAGIQCTTAACGGLTVKCHRTNGGTWSWSSPVPGTETNCADGYDNDCDGDIDGADGNCAPGTEVGLCGDFADNDNDLLTDCDDTNDCEDNTTRVNFCDNTYDGGCPYDTGDYVGCDLSAAAPCQPETNCGNGNCCGDTIDNDCDGDTDGADSDCSGAAEICDNSPIDDNADTYVDEAELTCGISLSGPASGLPNSAITLTVAADDLGLNYGADTLRIRENLPTGPTIPGCINVVSCGPFNLPAVAVPKTYWVTVGENSASWTVDVDNNIESDCNNNINDDPVVDTYVDEADSDCGISLNVPDGDISEVVTGTVTAVPAANMPIDTGPQNIIFQQAWDNLVLCSGASTTCAITLPNVANTWTYRVTIGQNVVTDTVTVSATTEAGPVTCHDLVNNDNDADGTDCIDSDCQTGTFNNCDDSSEYACTVSTGSYNACNLTVDVSCGTEGNCGDTVDNDCDTFADEGDSDGTCPLFIIGPNTGPPGGNTPQIADSPDGAPGGGPTEWRDPNDNPILACAGLLNCNVPLPPTTGPVNISLCIGDQCVEKTVDVQSGDEIGRCANDWDDDADGDIDEADWDCPVTLTLPPSGSINNPVMGTANGVDGGLNNPDNVIITFTDPWGVPLCSGLATTCNFNLPPTPGPWIYDVDINGNTDIETVNVYAANEAPWCNNNWNDDNDAGSYIDESDAECLLTFDLPGTGGVGSIITVNVGADDGTFNAGGHNIIFRDHNNAIVCNGASTSCDITLPAAAGLGYTFTVEVGENSISKQIDVIAGSEVDCDNDFDDDINGFRDEADSVCTITLNMPVNGDSGEVVNAIVTSPDTSFDTGGESIIFTQDWDGTVLCSGAATSCLITLPGTPAGPRIYRVQVGTNSDTFTIQVNEPAENCNDGIDNADYDSYADEADSECQAQLMFSIDPNPAPKILNVTATFRALDGQFNVNGERWTLCNWNGCDGAGGCNDPFGEVGQCFNIDVDGVFQRTCEFGAPNLDSPPPYGYWACLGEIAIQDILTVSTPAENCAVVGDEDVSGAQDCYDPFCIGQLGPNGIVCCGAHADCDDANNCTTNTCTGIKECNTVPNNLPCGVTDCPADVCVGPVIEDYPVNCTSMCVASACVACSCIATDTNCDASEECTLLQCGDNRTCHRTIGGSWNWTEDPMPTGENCVDTFDNDCDGDYDCDDSDCQVGEMNSCDSTWATGCTRDTGNHTDCPLNADIPCNAETDCPNGNCCGDGIDNNCDGYVDEADSDCLINFSIQPEDCCPGSMAASVVTGEDGDISTGGLDVTIHDGIGCGGAMLCNFGDPGGVSSGSCSIQTSNNEGTFNYTACVGENSKTSFVVTDSTSPNGRVTVTGNIVDADGNALDNVEIRAFYPPNFHTAAYTTILDSTYTDVNGNFALETYVGKFVLRASRDEYFSQEATFDVVCDGVPTWSDVPLSEGECNSGCANWEGRCNAACEGREFVTGIGVDTCNFFDQAAMQICDNKEAGVMLQYEGPAEYNYNLVNEEYLYLQCCEGAPAVVVKPVATVTSGTGDVEDLFKRVRIVTDADTKQPVKLVVNVWEGD